MLARQKPGVLPICASFQSRILPLNLNLSLFKRSPPGQRCAKNRVGSPAVVRKIGQYCTKVQ